MIYDDIRFGELGYPALCGTLIGYIRMAKIALSGTANIALAQGTVERAVATIADWQARRQAAEDELFHNHTRGPACQEKTSARAESQAPDEAGVRQGRAERVAPSR
jgi:hypothetical protein